jgi:hypothetical protein
MQCLEVSCAVQPIYGSLGAKGLKTTKYIGAMVTALQMTNICFTTGVLEYGFNPLLFTSFLNYWY